MAARSGHRRAIVHVGLPRTGTTTLQRVLSGLRPHLLLAGILYPELTPRSAAQPHLSHQYLGEALDGRRPGHERTELLEALSTQLSGTEADTVLLSYEGLCLAPPRLGVPQRLAALFARHGFAMEVLVTLKPQDELVNSGYTWRMQFLREARPFRRYFQAEVGQARLDLDRLLQPWHQASGGRLRAVPTRDAQSGEPLVERVFAELGLLPRVAAIMRPDDLALVENRSPGPVAVAVARLLRQGGAHLALGAAARDATRFVEDAARARGVDAMPFNGLDAAWRAAASDRWMRANDRFARRVWGEPWSARVMPQPATPTNEIGGPDDVGRCHVEQVLAQVCDRYHLRLSGGLRLALQDAAATAHGQLGRLVRYGRAMGS